MPDDPVPAVEPVVPQLPVNTPDVNSVQGAMQAAEAAVADAVAAMKQH